MAVALARRLEDGWTGILGAASTVPIAAVLLAKRLHAPNVTWICSATGFVNPTPSRLHPSSTEFGYRRGATAVLPYDQLASLFERGFDFGFFGGLEIDARAYANTVLTGSGRPGPGPAGLPVGMSRTRNVFLYTSRHTPRSLVRQVRHRTGVPRGRNVRALVTPLAEFAMDLDAPVVRTLLGASPEQVREATGFAFDLAADVTSLEPTPCELSTVRGLDADGLLRS
jgi:glutaconate CoA-transferase, subunit B